MNKWNSVYVSEMSHAYKRFLCDHDVDKFKQLLRKGLQSKSDFERAFTAGLVTWLAPRCFDITDEIDASACTLQEEAYPTMYDHPVATPVDNVSVLSEFRTFNVLITYFE